LTLSQYESILVKVADRSISQYPYEKKTVYARLSSGSVVVNIPVGNLLNKVARQGRIRLYNLGDLGPSYSESLLPAATVLYTIGGGREIRH
jgi:hypothetical protein